MTCDTYANLLFSLGTAVASSHVSQTTIGTSTAATQEHGKFSILVL